LAKRDRATCRSKSSAATGYEIERRINRDTVERTGAADESPTPLDL
jgi:hypothetical protein